MKLAAAAAVVVVLSLGCSASEEGASLTLLGRAAVEPPDCRAASEITDARSLFDVGRSAETANELIVALRTESTIPPATPLLVITPTGSSSFVTNVDGERLQDEDVVIVSTGSLDDVVFVDAITRDAAIGLQPLASEDPSVRIALDVHITLRGHLGQRPQPLPYQVAPSPGPSREVVSNEIVVPLDICSGCLVPATCPEGQHAGGDVCIPGVDRPMTCEPATP